MTPGRRRRWVRRLGLAAVAVPMVGAVAFSVVVLRDPALRGIPLGDPTPWPLIILEEAAAPSAPRWAALAGLRPPPGPVRACVVPQPRIPVPPFGQVRYCGRAQGQSACRRGILGTADRARGCALHASRVAEALLRRGNADGAWDWLVEARILLGVGAGLAADPATALELSLRIRQLDLDLARLLPWFPDEEVLQAAVAGLPPAGDTLLLRALREADWPTLRERLATAGLDPVWLTDSVAVAILARSWRGVPSVAAGVDPCPIAGAFWQQICRGEIASRGDRDPAALALDVARGDAQAYRRVQRRRLDSLLAIWAARQPDLVPRRMLVLGSDARIGRFVLARAGAHGVAVPWPRLVVVDVGRSLDRIASTLAHELGHHAQFRESGVWHTLRMGEPRREAEADAWGRKFLCRVGGPTLGRLGGRCPELVSD